MAKAKAVAEEKGAEKFDSLAELKKSDAKAFEKAWKSLNETAAALGMA